MAFCVVEFDALRTSSEVLALILRGSDFAVLADAEARRVLGGPLPVPVVPCRPAPEHRARELIHCVGLLALCLQLPDITDADREKWHATIADSGRELDALYADGLSRNFLGDVPGGGRWPQHGAL